MLPRAERARIPIVPGRSLYVSVEQLPEIFALMTPRQRKIVENAAFNGGDKGQARRIIQSVALTWAAQRFKDD